MNNLISTDLLLCIEILRQVLGQVCYYRRELIKFMNYEFKIIWKWNWFVWTLSQRVFSVTVRNTHLNATRLLIYKFNSNTDLYTYIYTFRGMDTLMHTTLTCSYTWIFFSFPYIWSLLRVCYFFFPVFWHQNKFFFYSYFLQYNSPLSL